MLRDRFERFYELMRQPKESKQIASTAFAATADAFLDWVKTNRAEDTYEWYRLAIQLTESIDSHLKCRYCPPVAKWLPSLKAVFGFV